MDEPDDDDFFKNFWNNQASDIRWNKVRLMYDPWSAPDPPNWDKWEDILMLLAHVVNSAQVVRVKTVVSKNRVVLHVHLKYPAGQLSTHKAGTLTINGSGDPLTQIVYALCPNERSVGHDLVKLPAFLRTTFNGNAPVLHRDSFKALERKIKSEVKKTMKRDKNRTKEIIKEFKQRSVKRAMRQAAGILRPLVRSGQIKKGDIKEIWNMLVVEEIHES
jgi:hypothetical protein